MPHQHIIYIYIYIYIVNIVLVTTVTTKCNMMWDWWRNWFWRNIKNVGWSKYWSNTLMSWGNNTLVVTSQLPIKFTKWQQWILSCRHCSITVIQTLFRWDYILEESYQCVNYYFDTSKIFLPKTHQLSSNLWIAWEWNGFICIFHFYSLCFSYCLLKLAKGWQNQSYRYNIFMTMRKELSFRKSYI